MRLLVWATLLVVASCGINRVPVSSDYDSTFDFSSLRSYAWHIPVVDTEPPKNIAENNDLQHRRIVDAINSQMRAKGLVEADSTATASVLISYHNGLADKVKLNSVSDWYLHYGYYPCYYCGSAWRHGRHSRYFHAYPEYHDDVWLTNYTENLLFIDVIDPTSKSLLWRGVAKRTLPRLENPEQRRLYVLETVQAILAEFPPSRAPSN